MKRTAMLRPAQEEGGFHCAGTIPAALWHAARIQHDTLQRGTWTTHRVLSWSTRGGCVTLELRLEDPMGLEVLLREAVPS